VCYFTIDFNGGFRANYSANATTCASRGFQFRRVIALSGNPLYRKRQHILRAGANTQFAALAKRFVYNDPTLKGHPILLIEISENSDKHGAVLRPTSL
jgi:hypothetical protein